MPAPLAREIATILFITGVCGVVANTLGPHRVPWCFQSRAEPAFQLLGVSIVDLVQVRRIVGKNEIILDARTLQEYEKAHIPGAISLPSDQIDEVFPSLQIALTHDQPILVYCSSDECDRAWILARFLHEQGYTKISLFPGGYRKWSESKLPTEAGS